MSVLATAGLAALAVAVLLRQSERDRLTAVLGRPVAAPGRSPRRLRLGGPLAACLVLAAALLLVLPLVAGLPAAVGAVAGGPRLLDRLEPGEQRRRRERLQADLPLLLELLAACLAGGAGPPAAAAAVAAAVGGPAGERLALVGAALHVGTPAAQAWAALAGAGSDDDPLAPAARALARAAEGGAPVASTVARLARDARLRSRDEGEAAARRVGVTAVAPLGLCFLPAFVLLGVVPIVAGLAGPLLSGS